MLLQTRTYCKPEEFHTKEKFPVEREKIYIWLISGLKNGTPPSKKSAQLWKNKMQHFKS